MRKAFVCGVTLCLLACSLWGAVHGEKNEKTNFENSDIPSLEEIANDYGSQLNGSEFPNLSAENGNYLFADDALAEEFADLVASSGSSSSTEREDEEEVYYTVTFLDFDGTVLSTETVKKGEDAVAPQGPTKDDDLFLGWDKSFSNVDSSMDVTAQYDDGKSPLLSFDSASVKPGTESVVVTLSVKNNPGILGMVLTLTYDESVMILKSAENGEAVRDVLTLTKAKVLDNGCCFVWDGESVEKEDVKDGEILTLTFDILKTAADGEYNIAVSYEEGDIVDGDLEPISVSLKSGSVTVSK